jgi:hypothetical protein
MYRVRRSCVYSFAEGKRCQKGKPCKGTCIDRGIKCLEDILPVLSQGTSKLADALGGRTEEEVMDLVGEAYDALDATQKKSFETFAKMREAGEITPQEELQVAKLLVSVAVAPKQADRSDARVMSYDEVQKIVDSGRIPKLDAAYNNSIKDGVFNPDAPGGMGDYVRENVNVVPISDRVSELAYGMLPAKARNAINNAGSVSGEGQVFAGRDENGNAVYSSSGNKARGVMLTKKWLEQDGKDPFTGEYIDLRKAEPEHLFSWSQAKDSGGKGDIDTNLAWANPMTNNSKAAKGIDDNFVKWGQQLEEWKAMGREKYDKEIVEPKMAKAAAAKGLKGGAETELGKALAAQTPEERVQLMRASVKAYGDRVRYLVRASGMESGEWAESIPGARKPRRQPFDARAQLDIDGKKIKPSEGLLVAMAALDAPQRARLIEKVDQIRMARQAKPAEIAGFTSGKDPGYLALRERLDRKFEADLAKAITDAVPSIGNYL